MEEEEWGCIPDDQEDPRRFSSPRIFVGSFLDAVVDVVVVVLLLATAFRRMPSQSVF